MRPEKVSRKTTNLGRLILLPLALLASNAFAQNPVPFIDQPLVPSAVAPGGPDFTLTVNGTGFVSGATVNWNGAPLTTTFVSSSQLTAAVPAANIAAPSTASITVTNPSAATASNAALFTVASPLNALTFISAPAPPVVKWAVSIVVGDFNGDGRLDLAVASFDSDTVAILLGNGDGTFTPAAGSPITVGSGPQALAVADLNGDGKADLAVANYRDDTVTILLGNGDGTFTGAAGSPVNVGNGPIALAAGDFNADGTLDLAVVDADGNNLTILLGNGDGTFRSEVSSPAGLSYPVSIVVGDFNGDDKLDLVVANSFLDNVTILLGNGDGTFAASTGSPVPIAVPAGTLALADFNGDGNLDLAVGGSSGGYAVVVLVGNGHGEFSQAPGSPITIGGDEAAIALGDFTGDGKVDLAVTNYGSNGVILLGNGDGTFAPAGFGSAVPAGEAITVGDFDGNGRLDLAVARYGGYAGISVVLLLPSVRLSSSALSFSDQTLNTISVAQSIQLINQSNASLNITGITASGDFAVQASGTTCSTSAPVAAGGNCTISVTFTPTALGSRTGTLTVTDDAENTPQTATLSGNGINPSAALSPTSLSFGNQNVATTSAAQPVTLTNSGVGTLSIESVVASGDFAQTNTCGTSVAQGASCTISVRFTPTAGGTRTGAITFTDNAANSPQTVSLTGTGALATITLSTTSLTFASQGVSTTSAAQPVIVTNSGTGSLLINSITTSGDFAQTNNCPSAPNTIAAGANCTINVTFTPTTGGTRAGFVTITDNAAGSPQTVSLTGTGVSPTASAAPASLSFGNVAVGTTAAAQAVTLSNSGPGPLAISGISVGGANANDFPQTNNCPGSLAASASCTINVTFKPTVNGAESGTLTISDNAASNPQNVSLSGTGQAPVAGLSPASLDFPGQTVGVTSAPEAVTLANSGSLPLTVSNVSLTSPFVVQSSTCPGPSSTLAAGSSCTINLTFTPGFAGTTFGSLLISDNSLGSAQQTVALTGEAAASFGDQPVGEVSTAQAVTVANGSTTKTVTVTGVTATGDFAVASNPCGALPPGGSCAPTVTFKPTAPGTRTGALMVSTSTGSPRNVPLTGTGLGATATLSKSSVAFASQFVGTSSSATAITVTNNGNQALNFTFIAASGDFSLAASGTTCAVGTAVAIGANCSVSVTFKPTAGGARSGAVTLADNAFGSPQTVALSGTGQDFSFAPPSGSPTSATVAPGSPATYTLSVGGEGGLSGTVTFACTGAPSEATCTVSPNPATLGSSASNVTVTVTTTAPSISAPRGPNGPGPIAGHRPALQRWLGTGHPRGVPLLLAMLGLLAVAAMSRRRRRPRPLPSQRAGSSGDPWIPAFAGMTCNRHAPAFLALALVLLLVLAWAACGGGGGGRTHDPGTPAGTSTLTVTGSTGSGSAPLTHTVTLTLTVS